MNDSILVFGEVLQDQFDNGLKRRGGAPFNVAWHLSGFQTDTKFISRVGNDALAKELLNDIDGWPLDKCTIQTDKKLPTGYVSVYNQATNPSFEIHNNVAYDAICFSEIPKEHLEANHKIIYHGSLALRNKTSRQTFDSLLGSNPKAPVFFDINLRPPWWDLKLIEHYLYSATYLKCNEAELKQIETTETNLEKAVEKLIRKFNLDSVIVTQGAEGAFCLKKDGKLFSVSPEKNIQIVNSVGAGDAFSAVMILGILNNWPVEFTLERASEFAAYICTIDGAVPDSLNIYENLKKRWI